jgi:hypothetical protein
VTGGKFTSANAPLSGKANNAAPNVNMAGC